MPDFENLPNLFNDMPEFNEINRAMMLVKILPVIFIALPVTLVSFLVILSLNGYFNIVLLFLEAILIGVVAALLVVFIGERKKKSGLNKRKIKIN